MATLRVTVLVGPETATAATGTITTVTGASLVDGETFTLQDGVNNPVTFEFDDDASVVQTDTLRAVTFTGAETANQIRDLIINAVNNAPALNITASDGGAATVDLEADVAGASGNIPVLETVADAGFVVAGLSGGADAASEGDKRRVWVFSGSQSLPPIAGNIRAVSSRSSYAYELNGPKIPNSISVSPYSPAQFDSGDLSGQDALVDQLSSAIEAGKVEVVDEAAPGVPLDRTALVAYL